MKPGMIVRIRLTPGDTLSVLDILDKANVEYKDMSFSQCTSLALSAMIAGQRTAGNIPTPDGFDYLTRIAPFQDRSRNGQKSKITNALWGKGNITPPDPTVPPVQKVTNVSAEDVTTCQALHDLGNQRSPTQEGEYRELMQRIYG